MTDIKAGYSVAELAALMGWDRRRLERMLRERSVPVEKIGGRYIVWLSALKEHMPHAWDSVVEAMLLRGSNVPSACDDD